MKPPKALLFVVLLVLLALPVRAQTSLSMVWRGTGGQVEAMRNVATVWGTANNVDVTVSEGAGDWDEYYDQIAVQVAAGVPVDIYLLDMQAIGLGASGIFTDLGPFIRQDGMTDDVPPVALDTYTVDGKIYGFPTDLYPNVIYYNQDLFENAGLDTPPADWNTTGWTWQDYGRSARTLTVTNSEGLRTQWGSNRLRQRTPAVIQSFGGRLITDESFNIDDPDVHRAVNFVYDLLINLRVEPQEDEDPGGGWNPFPFGRIAMQYTGTWMSPYLVDADFFRWNVAVTPTEQHRAAEVTINAIGIPDSSQQKQLAWSFIRYVTSDPNGSTAFVEALGGVPANRRGQLVYLEQQRRQFPDMNAEVAIGALPYAVVDPFRMTVNFRELDTVRTETFEAALQGQMNLGVALEQLKLRGDPILQSAQ